MSSIFTIHSHRKPTEKLYQQPKWITLTIRDNFQSQGNLVIFLGLASGKSDRNLMENIAKAQILRSVRKKNPSENFKATTQIIGYKWILLLWLIRKKILLNS